MCKSILCRVREARAIERADSLSLFPPAKPSQPPPRKRRAHHPMAPSKIVVLKIENGYFAPKSIPTSDSQGSPSAEPAKIVWEIGRRNLDVVQVSAVDTPTTICISSAPMSPANITQENMSPLTTSSTPISPAAITPATISPVATIYTTPDPTTEASAIISPVTLEYMGTNLTPSQLRYNSLARMADTKSIIAERIRFGMEEQDEVLEEATVRAHSWAECRVALLSGNLERQREALSEQQALPEASAANEEDHRT